MSGRVSHAPLVGFEREAEAQGRRAIGRDAAVIVRLSAMGQPGESPSDVIVRLVELEASAGVKP